MEYLIAVDLEGVNNVVGDAYVGLGKSVSDYQVAINQAVLEINKAVKALFDGGATKVVVWDNHGGGDNIDFSKIDPRAEKMTTVLPNVKRFDFCENYNFKGIVFIGYHSKEGAINGVLAHTYNSSAVQYFKVGGKAYGEFEIDATLTSNFGIVPLFASGDDVFLKEVKSFSPQTEVVETKKALGRNKAIFNDNEVVLQNIYNGVLKAMNKNIPLAKIPLPNDIEIRYTRTERATEIIDIQKRDFKRDFTYGEDAHIIKGYCNNVTDLKRNIIT
jgi:D-amino peptidase